MAIQFRPGDLTSKELLKNIIEQEKEELSKLDDDSKEKKNNDLRDLVKYYFELNKDIEEKCLRLSNFSLQFLILCSAGACALFLYREGLNIMFSTIAMSFFALQILFSLVIIAAYESGAKIKDSFYDIDIVRIGARKKTETDSPLKKIIHPLKQMISSSRAAPAYYLDGICSFVRNYREDDIDQKIINNTEQLYLFQAENAYCSRLYFRMRRLRFWSLASSVSAAVTLGALFTLISGQAYDWLMMVWRIF